MQHSRSPSRTDLGSAAAAAAIAAAAAAALAAGCGDDSCGTGGAPADGLVAAADPLALTYGDLTSLLGNDCPDPAAPEGIVSLSIEGRLTGGAAGLVTLCIPRPDLLGEGGRTLGTATSSADVRIIDLTGAAAGCTYALDTAQPPTGTASATGVCDGGDSPDGFALVVDGAATLRRTCGAAIDTVAVTLRGRVAVRRR